MRRIIKHYRSNTLGNVPDSDDIEYGEIAIQYNSESPSLFIKDDNDNIVKFDANNSIELFETPLNVLNDVFSVGSRNTRVISGITQDDYLNKKVLLNGNLADVRTYKKHSAKYDCQCQYYVFKANIMNEQEMCVVYYKRPYDDDEGKKDDLCFKYRYYGGINEGMKLPLYIRRLFSTDGITSKGLNNKAKKLIKKAKKKEKWSIPSNTTIHSPIIYQGETKLFEYGNYNYPDVPVFDYASHPNKSVKLEGRLLVEGYSSESYSGTHETKIFPEYAEGEYMFFVLTKMKKQNGGHITINTNNVGVIYVDYDIFANLFGKRILAFSIDDLRQWGAYSIVQDGSAPLVKTFVMDDNYHSNCDIIRSFIDKSSDDKKESHKPIIKTIKQISPLDDFIAIKRYKRNICTYDRNLSFYDKQEIVKSQPLNDFGQLFRDFDIQGFFDNFDMYAKCKRHGTHKWSRFFVNKKNVTQTEILKLFNFGNPYIDTDLIFKRTLLRAIWHCGSIDLVNNKRKVYLDVALFPRLGYRKKATYNNGLKLRLYLGPFNNESKIALFSDLINNTDSIYYGPEEIDIMNQLVSDLLHVRVIGTVKKDDILNKFFVI